MFYFNKVGLAAGQEVNDSGEMNSFIESNFGYQNYDSCTISVVSSVIIINKEINYEVQESELDYYIDEVDVSAIEDALRDGDEGKAVEEANNVYDEVWELFKKGEQLRISKLEDSVIEKFRKMIGETHVSFYTGIYLSGSLEEFYPNYQVEGNIITHFENNAFAGSQGIYIMKYVEKNMAEEVDE